MDSITVRDVLSHIAQTNDNVIFRDTGWYTGCAHIDNEDFFMYSLNPKLLDRLVRSCYYASSKKIPFKIFSSTHPTLIIELADE